MHIRTRSACKRDRWNPFTSPYVPWRICPLRKFIPAACKLNRWIVIGSVIIFKVSLMVFRYSPAFDIRGNLPIKLHRYFIGRLPRISTISQLIISITGDNATSESAADRITRLENWVSLSIIYDWQFRNRAKSIVENTDYILFLRIKI